MKFYDTLLFSCPLIREQSKMVRAQYIFLRIQAVLSSVSASVCAHIARRENAVTNQQVDDFPLDDIEHDAVLSVTGNPGRRGIGALREDTVS